MKPDKIPAGYMSACLENIQETHQIPLKNFTEATVNYTKVYHELKSFVLSTKNNLPFNNMNNDERTRRKHLRLTQPCVFFPSSEYEQTSRILDWLQEKAEG